MSTELAVGFTSPAGEELRIEWDEAALAALGDGEPSERPWRLAGELDWEKVETLRVLSGQIDDGRGIAIATLRPLGAAGHGEEAAGGAIVAEGAAEGLAEVLISTEYRGDAEIRRVGLELYPDEEGMPLRVAGDATATATEVDRGIRRLRVELELRLAGAPGRGVLEILTRA